MYKIVFSINYVIMQMYKCIACYSFNVYLCILIYNYFMNDNLVIIFNDSKGSCFVLVVHSTWVGGFRNEYCKMFYFAENNKYEGNVIKLNKNGNYIRVFTYKSLW